MRRAVPMAAVLLLVAVAAPLAPLAASAPVEQRYPATTHTCSAPAAPGLRGLAAAVRTCTFRNLYLYRGHAYYLSEGPAPDFAQLALYMHMWAPPKRPEQPWFLKGGYSPALFASLLARGTVVPPLERLPLAYLWRGYEVIPDAASGATCNGQSRVAAKSNYYHFVGEYLPLISATLCEEFGHCQPYGNRSALRIIDVAPPRGNPCNVQELYPPYFREGLACLSDSPLLHLAGSHLGSRLTLVETVWVGLGPRCRGMQPFDCYTPGGSRLPISGAQMAAWRSTAERCFGFQGNAVASLHPVRLLLVDRLYESGRSILNVASVVQALRRRFSSQQVELRLEYMEGLTIRQQAEIFSWASVVVHMHGAAIGNYAFLPRGAVVVHISPFPGRWPPALPFQWARDLQQVTGIEVRHFVNEDWSRVQVVPDIVAQQAARRGGVAQLVKNATFYAQYRGTFQCPEWLGRLRTPCQQYMSRSLTASLPPGKVAELAEAAVLRLFAKQQQRWEPQLAVPGAAELADKAVVRMPWSIPQATAATAEAAGQGLPGSQTATSQAAGAAALGRAGGAAGVAAARRRPASGAAWAVGSRAGHGPIEVLRSPLSLPPAAVSWVLVALGGAMFATWLLRREPKLWEPPWLQQRDGKPP
ncbi:hypothetical protein ABPG75_009093 [Micractinium tetrahymenae]